MTTPATRPGILAATDFSEDARYAVDRAARLAAEQGCPLTLLHVLSESALRGLQTLLPEATPGAIETKLDAEARALLDALAAELAQTHGVAVAGLLRHGRVVDEVLAASADARLLVLGARGTSSLRDWIIGSTAERLLKKSLVPVLVVRQAPVHAYRRVVVPVDFSAHSAVALRAVQRYAPTADTTVLNAFDVPFEGKLWIAGVGEEDIQRCRAEARRHALEDIDAVIEACGGANRPYRLVERGDAPRVILEHAKECGADLIVIGKHGQSMVEEFLLGSVTRHVLADAQCDVLIVRDRD